MPLSTTAPATSSSQPISAVLRCLALHPATRSTTGADVRRGGDGETGSAPYSSADGRFMGASLGLGRRWRTLPSLLGWPVRRHPAGRPILGGAGLTPDPGDSGMGTAPRG